MLAFLVLGGGALVAGVVVGVLAATSARRGWALFAAGALIAAVFVAVGWARAPEDDLACHDCSELLGRYALWVAVYFFAFVNWLAWAFGIATGAAVRAFVHARRELREQRGAA